MNSKLTIGQLARLTEVSPRTIRYYSGLGGKTPNDRYLELIRQTPLWAEVGEMYDGSKERIVGQNFVLDSAVTALKQSL
jgi:hypothetical protein